MRKRPTLSAGDVCRLSRKGRCRYSNMKNATLIVEKTSPTDTSEAWSKMYCRVYYRDSYGSHRTKKINVSREYLWYTGYNNISGIKPVQCRQMTENIRSGVCTCGGQKARTPCADWCDSWGKRG